MSGQSLTPKIYDRDIEIERLRKALRPFADFFDGSCVVTEETAAKMLGDKK